MFSAFQIQVNGLCLQVDPDSINVSFVWHCGTPPSSYYLRFLWKWYGTNNLINMQTRRCLAQDSTTVSARILFFAVSRCLKPFWWDF